jgi:cell division protein FtsB
LRWLLGTGAVFVVALLLVATAKSYQDLSEVLARKGELEVRLSETEDRTEELEYRLELLRSDPATLERLARDELGMVGPDDTVFVIQPEGLPASSVPRGY